MLVKKAKNRRYAASFEDKLCDEDCQLKYVKAVVLSLRAPASIAEKTAECISSISGNSKLSDDQINLIKTLLSEVKDISKNVKKDFVAEVQVPGESAAGDFSESLL